MRKVLISLAAAGTALAFATPAAAQMYPVPPHAYGQGYGQGYGHGQGYGYVRSLQVRIDGIQRQIQQLRARRILTRNEAQNLREQSRQVERRLFRAAQYGLSPYEAQDVQNRIARLERRLYRDAHDGRRFGRGYGQGYGQGYYGDRDRDGRNDRYEDDRGWDHD